MGVTLVGVGRVSVCNSAWAVMVVRVRCKVGWRVKANSAAVVCLIFKFIFRSNLLIACIHVWCSNRNSATTIVKECYNASAHDGVRTRKVDQNVLVDHVSRALSG